MPAGIIISGFEPWSGTSCCVLGQDIQLSQYRQIAGDTNWGEMTCDGLASRPGGVEILLAASRYKNRDKPRGSTLPYFKPKGLKKHTLWRCMYVYNFSNWLSTPTPKGHTYSASKDNHQLHGKNATCHFWCKVKQW